MSVIDVQHEVFITKHGRFDGYDYGGMVLPSEALLHMRKDEEVHIIEEPVTINMIGNTALNETLANPDN